MQELFKGSRRKDITLKPIALAVALALLNGGSLAASMSDVVSTRRAQSFGDQYGRDSLYASSPDDRRFESEQNSPNSSWFSRSVKADRPETLGKTASLALHDSAHSVNLLPGNRPQAYGRAGGYVGWERIAMMQSLQTTVASSAFRGKNMVKNGPDVADLLVGDDRDRRKSAARSGNDVNLGLSATNEAERRSAPGTRAIPQTNNKQPGSGSAAPSEPTPLRSNDQFAALVQSADDMSAMEPPSGGHDEPNSKAHREPNPFITEEHNSATSREESADMSATDNGSGDQPAPVGRALPAARRARAWRAALSPGRVRRLRIR